MSVERLSKCERASLWLCVIAAASVWLTVGIRSSEKVGSFDIELIALTLGVYAVAVVTSLLALPLTLQSLSASRRTILWAVPLGLTIGLGWYALLR